ncbi:TerB family tellurite resistance protein [Acidiphilium sp.]|uniref:tellurite resistance TerB family protein n=1 Tax=Acidiphilium sp. TaxID=527 RepID=UPI002CFFB0AB|nr:TerB family tellurite resistance protein [Acidiphilium sp.]HQT62835.1 TerB family tellurite resistance protein [Acidiphilium sp.]
MFDALRNLLSDLTAADDGPAGFEDNDYRVAAAALLLHVADIDGEVSPPEKRRLRAIVTETFGIEGADAARLLAAAEQSEQEAVDLYHFTSVLKRSLDAEGRRKIVELCWQMAFADGRIDEFEENVIWRIAELLGVSNRERILLRQQVAGEAGSVPDGPWARRDT